VSIFRLLERREGGRQRGISIKTNAGTITISMEKRASKRTQALVG